MPANPRASEGWFLQLIRLAVVLIGPMRGTPPNNRVHLTGYCGLRPLPPAGDAERYA